MSAQTKLLQDKGASVTKFYPNPATTAINFEIKLGNEKGVTLRVFNFMGKSVFEITTITPNIYIPLDGFNRGVYIYQLRNKFGRIIDSGRFQVIK